MNARIIKAVLRKKHEDFVKSIKDENVRKMVDQNSIITDGSIVSMLLKEKVNDFDYYFTDFETVKAVTKYYVNEFNRLHKDKSNANTTKPYMEIDVDTNRVKIRTPSGKVAGENTNENQYQYFENRPIEEGEEYVKELISNILEDSHALDGTVLEKEEKEKYRPVFLTDNAITLSNKIQLTIRFHGNPEEIHANYDFIHCSCYWTSKDKKLVLPPKALESMLTK